MNIKTSEFGNTEYHILIAKNDYKKLSKKINLLNNTHNIFEQAIDRISNSLLHKAVFSGNFQICKFLINKKHDIDCKNMFGQTPLHIAYLNNNNDIIELLIESGASTDIKDSNNNTPLDFKKK